MVIDSSVLLAVFFEEPQGGWASHQLQRYKNESVMSTINLSEVLIHLQHHRPDSFQKVKMELLHHSKLHFIAPDVNQAILAAQARLKYPLNIGDCFAYALAKMEQCSILTLDKDFLKTDIEIISPYS